MSLNAALPGQPYPLVDGKRCLTAPWYNSLIRIANDAAVNDAISTLGPITGGTLYTNGSYTNVPLIGGAGNGATANITVAGGSVTGVTIVNPGALYQAGNILSANASSIGGTGSGFSVPVATVKILSVALPGQPYPIVDENGNITAPWYNSLVRIANHIVGAGLNPALPGQSYPLVKEKLINTPWYDALVRIANSVL